MTQSRFNFNVIFKINVIQSREQYWRKQFWLIRGQLTITYLSLYLIVQHMWSISDSANSFCASNINIYEWFTMASVLPEKFCIILADETTYWTTSPSRLMILSKLSMLWWPFFALYVHLLPPNWTDKQKNWKCTKIRNKQIKIAKSWLELLSNRSPIHFWNLKLFKMDVLIYYFCNKTFLDFVKTKSWDRSYKDFTA